MKQSARCGAIGLVGLGLALVALGHGSVWERLLGLQTTMMGFYLLTLAGENNRALQWALRGRLVLLVAELVWWALTSSSVWWLVWFGLEGLGLLFTPGVVRPAKPFQNPPNTRPFPGLLHNLGLGAIPLGEGIGALCFGALYGPLALGVTTMPKDLPAAALFGLHTLYLAFFWVVIVNTRAPRTMGATALGRVGVAVAFVGFHIAHIVQESARFWILAPLLVLSAIWTGLELRGWGVAFVRTTLRLKRFPTKP